MPPRRGGKSASSTSQRSKDSATPTSTGRRTSTTPRPSSAQQHKGNTRHRPPNHKPEKDNKVKTSSHKPSSPASSRQNPGYAGSGRSKILSSSFQGEAVTEEVRLEDGEKGVRTCYASPSASKKEAGRGRPKLSSTSTSTMSCKGKKTSSELIEEADEVMKIAKIEKSPNPTRQGNEFFKDEVKLRGKEKHHAANEFSRLRNNLLESLDMGSAWRWEVLNAGSSYDGTKVTRPDEMDCMFLPEDIPEEWMTIDFNGAPPGFCFIKLKKLGEPDTKYKALKNLCDDKTMRINARKFQQMAFKLFKNGTENTRKAEAGRAGPGAAALPVEYKVIPSSKGQGLLPISVDLVPALRFKAWPSKLKSRLNKLPTDVKEGVEKAGLHVVPKPCIDADGYEGDRDFLWRLSFSAAEKEMTKFLDGKYRNPTAGVVTTCRKQVMRVMKRILEICKGFNNSKTKQLCENAKELKLAVTTLQRRRNTKIKHFCTFTIRTALWDSFYVQHRDDDHWDISKKRSRLLDTLELLKKMLMGQTNVSHFFVPEIDIMSSVPVEEREFLYVIFTIAERLF